MSDLREFHPGVSRDEYDRVVAERDVAETDEHRNRTDAWLDGYRFGLAEAIETTARTCGATHSGAFILTDLVRRLSGSYPQLTTVERT